MIQTNKITKAEIRNLNLTPDDILASEFETIKGIHHNFMSINGVRVLSFTTANNRHLAKCKIQMMGFGWGVSKSNNNSFEKLMNT
jgi:hypothetical protein